MLSSRVSGSGIWLCLVGFSYKALVISRLDSKEYAPSSLSQFLARFISLWVIGLKLILSQAVSQRFPLVPCHMSIFIEHRTTCCCLFHRSEKVRGQENISKKESFSKMKVHVVLECNHGNGTHQNSYILLIRGK